MALKDNASLALIPAAYKTSKVYSAIPTNGDGDFTFSRSGTSATRINKAGLVETMGANVPRLNYDLTNGTPASCPSLLLEPERTNFNTNSENFSSSYSTVGSPVSVENNLTSPNGGINAAKQTIATTGNGYYKFPTTVTENTDYTVSAFFKYISGSGEVVRFGAAGGVFGGDQENRINIKTGVVEFTNTGNTVVVEEYPNEWYRVSCTKDATSSGTGGFSMFTNADDMVFGWWGVQFEAGSYATSYIPTTIAVTRTVDTCGDAGNDTIIKSEGSLFVDFTTSNSANLKRIYIISNTDFNNSIFIQLSGSSFAVQIVSGGTILYSWGFAITLSDRHKLALRYKDGDSKLYYNGTQQTATPASGTWFTDGLLNKFTFSPSSFFNFYGEVNQTMIFKEALTDAELITLTT